MTKFVDLNHTSINTQNKDSLQLPASSFVVNDKNELNIVPPLLNI